MDPCFCRSLAHQLTVCARQGYLEPDLNESVGKLRTFNELEHIVTGQLTHIVADQNRIPTAILLR